MTDQDPANDPIPGWPSPSEPTSPPEGAPAWAPPGGAPTYPGAQPPPAAGPPGAYPPAANPPGAYPPGGYGPPPTVPPGPGVPPAPGYGPPPGYGYGGQGYGGYPMAREHPQGTTILVLGICSWVICGLLAPVAWVMGNNAMKEIDQNPGAYSNRGNVQAGRILGMVYTILIGVGLVLFGVLVMIGIFAGASSSS